MQLFLLFFASIVGVPKDLIEARITGLGNAALSGFQILLTAAVAWMNGTWCAYTVVANYPYAAVLSICAGSIWAAIICTLDISLLRSVNKLSPGSKRQVRARLALACTIGLTLATPTELLICSPVIEHEIRADRRAEIRAEAVENAAIEHVDDRRSEASRDEEAVSAQEKRLNGEPDTYEFRDAARQVNTMESLYRTTVTRNTFKILQLRQDAEVANSESTRQNIRDAIRRLEKEDRTVAEEREAARGREDDARRAWDQTERARLNMLTAIEQRSATASQQASEKTQARDSESESALNGILNNSFINRFLTFEHIKWDFKNRACAGLWLVSLGFDSLLVVIEVLPILIKINGDPTLLDHKMHNRALLGIHRDNLEKAFELKALQASAKVREEVLERLLENMLRKIADPTTTTEELKEMKEQSKDDLAA